MPTTPPPDEKPNEKPGEELGEELGEKLGEKPETPASPYGPDATPHTPPPPPAPHGVVPPAPYDSVSPPPPYGAPQQSPPYGAPQQSPPYGVPVPPPYPVGPPKPPTTLSMLSMVFGIVSVPLACCWGFGFIFAVAGIILGHLGRKKEVANGMAMTGLIISYIVAGLCLAALVFILAGVAISTVPGY